MVRNKKFWVVSLLLLFSIVSCSSKKEMRRNQADAIRKLGVAHMEEENYATAFQQFQKAKELNPDSPRLYFDLGNFYYEKEKFDKAIEEYKTALKLKPDFASAKNNLGKAYLAKKEYDTAIACFKELIDNYIYATPHYPLFSIGQAYFFKHDLKSAEIYFKKSLAMNPDFTFATYWLGRTYVEMGKGAEAVEILEKTVDQSPQNASGYFELGKAYILAKELKKAQYAFEKVVALDPDSSIAGEANMAINRIKSKY